MGNTMTTPLPTWDDVREASEELDQMASQTVLKACDVGDMLRSIRLTMDAKSFNNHLLSELSRSQPWSVKLIALSFRRSAVLEALANGKANDSIRSAYEHVNGLSESAEETAERKQWPKAQRGPKKGSGNAGRPKGNAAPKDEPKSNPKHLGWSAAVQQDYRRLYDEVDFPEGFGRNNLTQQPSIRERVFATAGVEYSKRMTLIPGSDESTALATAVYQCWAEDNPAPKQETQQQKETLSQRKQREFDQLVQKEIGRIRAAGNNELRKEMEKLKAQWQVKIDAATDRELQKLAEFRRARQIREGMTAIMPNEEFDKLIRLLHPDRYPEEYRSKVDQAVQILRRYVSPCLNREPKPIPRGHNPFRENANV